MCHSRGSCARAKSLTIDSTASPWASAHPVHGRGAHPVGSGTSGTSRRTTCLPLSNVRSDVRPSSGRPNLTPRPARFAASAPRRATTQTRGPASWPRTRPGVEPGCTVLTRAYSVAPRLSRRPTVAINAARRGTRPPFMNACGVVRARLSTTGAALTATMRYDARTRDVLDSRAAGIEPACLHARALPRPAVRASHVARSSVVSRGSADPVTRAGAEGSLSSRRRM